MDKLKQYLTQASTWKGLIYVLGALGIYSMAPETQDAVVTHVLAVVSGLFAVSGIVDIFKNDKKTPS